MHLLSHPLSHMTSRFPWRCRGIVANGVSTGPKRVVRFLREPRRGRRKMKKIRVTKSLGESTRQAVTTASPTPFSYTQPYASYVEETMMRLFPPGFTVVDRGSGSLTAQASLSIDRGSSRASEFRRTRPTRLGRLSPRANGRFTSPFLSLISSIG